MHASAIYRKDGPSMIIKTPEELLKDAEAFFKRIGFDERLQKFLESDEAKTTINDGIDLIKQNIGSVKKNAPAHKGKVAEKLYGEYLEHEADMRKDIVDNFKRRLYAVFLHMYTISGDNDEIFKLFNETTQGIGYDPFQKDLQQVCIEVASGVTTGYIIDLF